MEHNIVEILMWIGVIYLAFFLIEFFLGLLVLGGFVVLVMLAISVGMVQVEQYPQLIPALLAVLGLYVVIKGVLYLIGGRDDQTPGE